MLKDYILETKGFAFDRFLTDGCEGGAQTQVIILVRYGIDGFREMRS